MAWTPEQAKAMAEKAAAARAAKAGGGEAPPKKEPPAAKAQEGEGKSGNALRIVGGLLLLGIVGVLGVLGVRKLRERAAAGTAAPPDSGVFDDPPQGGEDGAGEVLP